MPRNQSPSPPPNPLIGFDFRDQTFRSALEYAENGVVFPETLLKNDVHLHEVIARCSVSGFAPEIWYGIGIALWMRRMCPAQLDIANIRTLFDFKVGLSARVLSQGFEGIMRDVGKRYKRARAQELVQREIQDLVQNEDQELVKSEDQVVEALASSRAAESRPRRPFAHRLVETTQPVILRPASNQIMEPDLYKHLNDPTGLRCIRAGHNIPLLPTLELREYDAQLSKHSLAYECPYTTCRAATWEYSFVQDVSECFIDHLNSEHGGGDNKIMTVSVPGKQYIMSIGIRFVC